MKKLVFISAILVVITVSNSFAYTITINTGIKTIGDGDLTYYGWPNPEATYWEKSFQISAFIQSDVTLIIHQGDVDYANKVYINGCLVGTLTITGGGGCWGTTYLSIPYNLFNVGTNTIKLESLCNNGNYDDMAFDLITLEYEAETYFNNIVILDGWIHLGNDYWDPDTFGKYTGYPTGTSWTQNFNLTVLPSNAYMKIGSVHHSEQNYISINGYKYYLPLKSQPVQTMVINYFYVPYEFLMLGQNTLSVYSVNNDDVCIDGISIEIYGESSVIGSMSVSQRNNASGLVDIHYDLLDEDSQNYTISIEVSDDGGQTWNVPVSSGALSGDIGEGVTPGSNKHIIWDAGKDLPGIYGTNFKVRIIADDGN